MKIKYENVSKQKHSRPRQLHNIIVKIKIKKVLVSRIQTRETIMELTNIKKIEK